ncbi:MAG: hypothetical protein ACRC2R_08770 [Xenococcaceae cyanobacterium]
MSDINIDNLVNDELQNFRKLDDLPQGVRSHRELEKIQGGESAPKSIRLPIDKFPPGGGGCLACLSGCHPIGKELA